MMGGCWVGGWWRGGGGESAPECASTSNNATGQWPPYAFLGDLYLMHRDEGLDHDDNGQVTIMMEIQTSPSLNISISICKRSSLPTEYSKRFLLKIDEDDGHNCEHNRNQGSIMIILREHMIATEVVIMITLKKVF